MGILIKTGTGTLLNLYKAAIIGMQVVNNQFFAFYTQKKYEILFTGQIIYMKRYLNDQFDSVSRRIYISTNEDSGIASVFFYNVAESLGDFIYNVAEGGSPFLKNVGEQISEFDFTVYVPSSLSYNQVEFEAAIAKYKLEDKTYNIQTF